LFEPFVFSNLDILWYVEEFTDVELATICAILSEV